MAHFLTSWKEISQYVGKGVRTLQRWERESGFPVRRPNQDRKVLAIVEEIDAWVRSQATTADTGQPETELTNLRKEIAELKAENAELRAENESLRHQLGSKVGAA